MLKDISKIRIEGCSYTKLTELDFFNPFEGKKEKIVKGCIIYGRNGSGKSTIAKAFRKIRDNYGSEIIKVELLDKNNVNQNITDEERKNIFIFDEYFVDNNIKLQKDHLDTIIMLGESVNLADEITEAEEQLEEKQQTFESIQKKYDM